MRSQGDRSQDVDLDRFLELVDAYGAEPGRWPERERAGALALLATSPEARAACREAAKLDGLLDELPAYRPSAVVAARILATVPAAQVRRGGPLTAFWRSLWPSGPIWRPAGGLAAAALLGLAVGLTVPEARIGGATDLLTATDLDALAYGTVSSEEELL